MFYAEGTFSIRDVFWIKQKSCSSPATGRTHSALSVRLQGSALFRSQGREICVNPGDVIFIPAGVDYWIDHDEEELIILHLDASVQFSGIEVLTPQDTGSVLSLLKELFRLWKQQQPGYRNLCTAKLYELFALLQTQTQAPKGKFALIEPGVIYLNGHFDDPALTVETLAGQCGISQVYFRALFKERFGTSPVQAIRQRRLQQAAKMLSSGYYTVNEAAALCGFPDVKYFSTAFKSAYHTTPSEYKKNS